MLNIIERGDLIDTAAGRMEPDLILRNARLLSVHTCEVLPSDIAIKHGYVASVARPGESTWKGPEQDLGGRFVSPGFMDPHVHIESSLVTVAEYARAVMSRGVTTVAFDPHEMGNILGIPGMKLMIEEAKSTPLRVRLRVPGRIPAMPAWLETSGAALNVAETIDMLDWPEAVCLAGDINPQLLVRKDADQLAKIQATRDRRMTVAGQSPGLTGSALDAYTAAGPEDSHAAASIDEIIANQRVGLRSIFAIRGWMLTRKHLGELARRIAEMKIDTRYLQFCTDDVIAYELLDVGHLDARVRMAIEEGINPFLAYQMATVNVAEGLRLDHDFGAIVPGRAADLIVIRDMNRVDVEATMIGGKWVYGRGAPEKTASTFSYPAWSKQTMRVKGRFSAQDMQVRVESGKKEFPVCAIRATHPKLGEEFVLKQSGGSILPDPAQEVSSIVVVDRHTASGRIGRGFVSSFYVKQGALATTVSHDAHNLMVIGANHEDMAIAANRAVEIGGGYVLALNGEIIFEMPLPIAGLMCEDPIEVAAARARELVALIHDRLGAPRLDHQVLQRINFLGLPNIPDFGFTDYGLVKTDTLELLDLLSNRALSMCACHRPLNFDALLP